MCLQVGKGAWGAKPPLPWLASEKGGGGNGQRMKTGTASFENSKRLLAPQPVSHTGAHEQARLLQSSHKRGGGSGPVRVG